MKDLKNHFQPTTLIDSVNWHITFKCNYSCKFCYLQNSDLAITEILEAERILSKLGDLGIEKVNIVGGEPLLYPFVFDIIRIAKNMGFITTLSTNGSLLTSSKIKLLSPYLDWIELPVDSKHEEIEKKLGRGCGNHVQNIIKALDILKCTDIRVKITTVVTKLNCKEDMKPFINILNPDKWEIFHISSSEGQNCKHNGKLTISHDELENYMKLNKNIVLNSGEKPVFKRYKNITNSCFMLPLFRDMSTNSANIYYMCSFKCVENNKNL